MMLTIEHLLLLLLSSWICFCSGAKHDPKLPTDLDTCYRDDPQLAKCIKKAIEKLVPIYRKGSPDLELKPFDPLDFYNLKFSYKSSLVGGDATLSKAHMDGLSNFKVLDVRPKVSDPNKFILDFDVLMPRYRSKTDYALKGNVLTTNNVLLNGNLDIEYLNATLKYHVEGDVKKINNEDHIMLKQFTWRYTGEDIQGLNVLNSKVVEGKPLINGIVVSLLRTSWRPLLNQILPALLPSTDTHLRDVFYKLFMKYPYDVILPKSKPLKNPKNDQTS